MNSKNTILAQGNHGLHLLQFHGDFRETRELRIYLQSSVKVLHTEVTKTTFVKV